MLVRGSMALAIVTAGIGLGAVLGSAANPEMKQPPEQPWRAAPPAPFIAEGEQPSADAGPADFASYRESYAPSWAHEELTDWEPGYPAWTYSDLAHESFAEPTTADEGPADEHPALEPEALAPSETLAAPSEPEALSSEPQVAGNLAALY